MKTKKFDSRIIDEMHETARGLHRIGLIDKRRMNELDAVQSTNSDLDLQYNKTLSTLQDLDYTKAISDFSQNQTLLQAAQQSFAAVQGLSLFKYI